MNFDKKVAALLEMAGIARHFGKTKRVSEFSSEEERVQAVKSIADNIEKLKQNIQQNPDDPDNLKMAFDIYDLIVNNLPEREGYNVGKEFKTKAEIFKDLLDVTIVPESLYQQGKVSSWHDYREMSKRTIDRGPNNLKESGFSLKPIAVNLSGKTFRFNWFHFYKELMRQIFNKKREITSMAAPRNRKEQLSEKQRAEEEVYYFGLDGEPYRTFVNAPNGQVGKAFWHTNQYKPAVPDPKNPGQYILLPPRKVTREQAPQLIGDWERLKGSFIVLFNTDINTVRQATNHAKAKAAFQKKFPPSNPAYESLYRSGRLRKV